MEYFRIEGGHRLQGTIVPQGAKNEALQVLCACLLTAEEVEISNLPRIHDVLRLVEILAYLGVEVSWPTPHTVRLRASNIILERLGEPHFREQAGRLRGSIMLVGPLLARFGLGFVPRPGGDKIGRRRLDTHLQGLVALGGVLDYSDAEQGYWIRTKGLAGTYMLLDEASVTGTANIIMAAVLAKGYTEIFNAACEPYVQQLCRMLVQMGAKIDGIGSNLLRIEGVASLKGCSHRLLPDMIEVGSFIGMAAITGGEVRIKDVSFKDLGIIPLSFQRLGIRLQLEGDDLLVPAQDSYEIETFMDGSIMTIADAPWPGLTPDLLSVFLVVATQARGAVLIHQKMFESRLFFVDKLIDMGAQIILCDPHRATVIGHGHQFQLKAAQLTSPDIRAGVALLIAAMAADGVSRMLNIEQIDRGYEQIDLRLNQLGANIVRAVE